MKKITEVTVQLEAIVGGGQAIGTLTTGKKLFAWGGLPGETVTAVLTKKKAGYVEAIVTDVITPSPERIQPLDPDSYMSTSPWQIMTFAAEQHYKAALIEEAFELHDIVLPHPITVFSDDRHYGYRNKIEFSWWWDTDSNQLDLAFFRRGTHGKLPVSGTSLANPAIITAAHAMRTVLRQRGIEAHLLKTLLIRCDQAGNCAVQLYVKDETFVNLHQSELEALNIQGFELIFSNPKSPASVITKRLQTWGTVALTDTILDTSFTYATEGFFQINLPLYEQALRDMQQWVPASAAVLDLYSGVGSIGLTIGGTDVTMIENNEHAVREMERNIQALGRTAGTQAILAPAEQVLDFITPQSTVIVDPPRAGLHAAVIDRLLSVKPPRIIYLSCNPVTQARDVAKLAAQYGINHHKGYNFFPRTPHIEHLVVLDALSSS